jgi:hypothetical protein
MSVIAAAPMGSSPSLARRTGGLIRWVCTSNPFYVLSAGLFLGGLWISFGNQDEAENTWALMSGLAGYTLLLAVTACLLVRFGHVWDDVRTVLLLVVLMFLATSVTFDEVLASTMRAEGLPSQHPWYMGIVCYLGGLVFAIGVSEFILQGIRLKFPAAFRIPYYLILALFFLYPLALSPLVNEPNSPELMWGLFGFSPVAGLVFLTLIPAILRGRAYLNNNGSPWIWPLYPWVLFGLLAFAVAGRSFLLVHSLHLLVQEDYRRTIFGPYFLVPFGFSLTILFLELGLVSRSAGAIRTALLAPVGLVLLTLVGHHTDPLYQHFLDLFTEQFGGSPLFLTVQASVVFYTYAALRGVPLATEGLTAALVTLGMVSPNTLPWNDFVSAGSVAILAAGTLQLGLGLWYRNEWRCLVGGGVLAVAAALALPDGNHAVLFKGAVAFHLSLATVLIIGAAFNTAVGRQLRMVGAALVLVACKATLFGQFDLPEEVPPWAITAYAPVMAAILGVYGLLMRHQPSKVVAVFVVVCWVVTAGWWAYCELRKIVRGLDYIAVSMVLFGVAFLTSLGKSRVLARLRAGGVPLGESGPPPKEVLVP